MKTMTMGLLIMLFAAAEMPAKTIYKEPARLIRVISADTLTILYNGKWEELKLIGLDALETALNDKVYEEALRDSSSPDVSHQPRHESVRIRPTLPPLRQPDLDRVRRAKTRPLLPPVGLCVPNRRADAERDRSAPRLGRAVSVPTQPEIQSPFSGNEPPGPLGSPQVKNGIITILQL